MRFLRWLQAWSAAVLWAFVLVGAIGLAEGLSHWFRYGPPVGYPDHGRLDSVIPYLTLYGWLGLASAGVLFWPLAALLGRRDNGKRLIFAGAVAGALALLLTVDLGYLIKDSTFALWWDDHVGPRFLIKATAYLFFLVLLVGPMRRLADHLVINPRRHLFWPVVVVVVTTAFWPDWQAEGAKARTAGMTLHPGAESVTGKNLLLLTIDTLRRDDLGCLSDAAPSTPALDALADDGILYGNLWGTSSWTLPNMATGMTGLPSQALGLVKFVGLPDAATTMAEVAWRHGWRTAAIISNPYLGQDYGFHRGFEEFDHAIVVEPLTPAGRSVLVREMTRYWLANTMPNDASILVTKAMIWLGLVDDQRPFFLWIHLLDPHLPYTWRPIPGEDNNGPPPLPDHPLLAGQRFEGLSEVRAALPDIDPELASAIRLLHQQEVRYADAWSGRLFARLKAENLLENTVVVVLSDHGEEFFEHGGFEHGHSLMPEISSVPMIVRLPDLRKAGTRTDDPFSTLDLVPSICHEMGWEPPEGVPGRASLWPDESGHVEPPTRFALLDNMLYGGEQMAWWSWPYYRIEDLESGLVRWYDLSIDPEALSPLPSAPPAEQDLREEARRLQVKWDALAEQLGSHREGDASGVSEATRQRLHSLGY